MCKTLKWEGFPGSTKEFQGYQSFKTHNLDILLYLRLRRAIASLEKSIRSYTVLSENSTLTMDDINTVKAGVIQKPSSPCIPFRL